MSEMSFYPVLGTEKVFEPINDYCCITRIEFVESMPDSNFVFLESKDFEIEEQNIVYKWDVSDKQDGSILAWLEDETILKISGNGIILANEDCSYLFSSFSSVKNIVFNGLLDTSNMQNAKRMFLQCESLESVDVSNWNTQKLENSSEMFAECALLKSIDLSNWDTRNLVNASGMFKGYSNLKEIKLSGWNLENLIYAGEMFFNCFELETVDLSGWQSVKLKFTDGMFGGCENLKVVITNDKHIIKEVKEGLCHPCSIQFPRYYSIINEMPILGTKEVFKPIRRSNLFISEIKFVESIPNLDEVEDKWDVSDKQDGSIMAWMDNDTLYISGNGTILANENCNYLFSEMNELEKIETNELLSTDKTKCMSGMFSGCCDLKQIDMTNWNTNNLEDIIFMFDGCNSLENVITNDPDILYELENCRSEQQENIYFLY